MKGLRPHGWAGLAFLVSGTIGVLATEWWPLHTYFTPWMWTGYLLFLDALVFRLRGHSLLVPRPARFLTLLPISAAFWFLFEGYNLHLRNWVYVGLPASPVLEWTGYVWSFATIWPALFLTADLLEELGLQFRGRAATITGRLRITWIGLGIGMAVIPLLLPAHMAAYTFAFVWCAFVFLLEPILFRIPSVPSLLREAGAGLWTRWLSLGLSGLICGLLWESWNMLASAKWIYILPLFQEVKLFEMPLPGFLGFIPFAWEAWCMYWVLVLFLRRITSFDLEIYHGPGRTDPHEQ